MADKIFLLVKCSVETTHKSIHDAIAELQSKTDYHIGSTRHVTVLKTEIMQLKTRTSKSKRHGTFNKFQ